jgi:hypothetical protein
MYKVEDKTLGDTLDSLISSSVTGTVNTSDSAFAAIKSFQSNFKQLVRTPNMIRLMLQVEFNFSGVVDASDSNINKKQALNTDWFDSTFVVTDYSSVEQWLKKAISEAEKGRTVVCLVPSRTNTHWFHDLVLDTAIEVRFVKGRVTMTSKTSASSMADTLVIYQGIPNKRRRLKGSSQVAVIKCSTDMQSTTFTGEFE